MRLRSAPLLGLALSAVLVAGCDAGASSPEAEPSATASSALPSSASPSTTPSESSSPAEGTVSAATTAPTASSPAAPETCAPQDGITITIYLGAVDCPSAYAIAAKLDDQGAKRQRVDGFVCEYGNAMTRPTIFTCTDKRRGAEFSADET